jgi:hypothetical protein
MYESGNAGAKVEDYVLITTRQTASATEQEITMSGRTALIAISAAIALGVVGASVARANDSGENHQDLDRAQKSVVRVIGNSVSAGGAYGYAAEPTRKHRTENVQIPNR